MAGIMNTTQLIETMVRASGRSMRDISMSLGKNETWLNAIVWRESDVRASTLYDIAAACGFEIVAKGHGGEIVLDPSDPTAYDVEITLRRSETDNPS